MCVCVFETFERIITISTNIQHIFIRNDHSENAVLCIQRRKIELDIVWEQQAVDAFYLAHTFFLLTRSMNMYFDKCCVFLAFGLISMLGILVIVIG